MSLPLTLTALASGDLTDAVAILVVALGLAGVAILTLFGKRKI